MNGVVKSVKNDRNPPFGFIKVDGGEDIYFKATDSAANLKVGDRVTFETEAGSNGRPAAKNVRLTAPAGATGGAAPSSTRLPDECVFETFYEADGQLKLAIFYEAAKRTAEIFDGAGVKSTQRRQIYNQFLALISRLREDKNYPAALEAFGVLYVERVERAFNRKVLEPEVLEFFRRHRGAAHKNAAELQALFRYFTNILCYAKQA